MEAEGQNFTTAGGRTVTEKLGLTKMLADIWPDG